MKHFLFGVICNLGSAHDSFVCCLYQDQVYEKPFFFFSFCDLFLLLCHRCCHRPDFSVVLQLYVKCCCSDLAGMK